MKYKEIVFLQDEEATIALSILDKYGPKAAIIHLQNMYEGCVEPKIMDVKPWGDSDIIYKSDTYILSYNEKIGYIGLCCSISAKEIPTS